MRTRMSRTAALALAAALVLAGCSGAKKAATGTSSQVNANGTTESTVSARRNASTETAIVSGVAVTIFVR